MKATPEQVDAILAVVTKVLVLSESLDDLSDNLHTLADAIPYAHDGYVVVKVNERGEPVFADGDAFDDVPTTVGDHG